MNVQRLPLDDEQETGVARYDEVRAAEEIKVQAFLARRYPRDIEKAAEQTMALCKRPTFAPKGYYIFSRGGVDIAGPAVGLARAFAAAWGNILYGVEVAMDTEEKRRLRGWAWDLETNTRIMMEDEFLKLVQRKQKDENGKVIGPAQWVTPDERDLRELTNRRGALLERNCLLKLLPPDRADEGATRCMIAEEGEIAGYDKPAFAETVKAAIAAFGKLGVSEARVLARVHKKDLASMTASDIVKLRAIMRGIDGGYTTVAAEFSGPAATASRSKVDDLKAKPKPAPEKPKAETVVLPGQGTPGEVDYIPPEEVKAEQGHTMEADDVELFIASLINKNATKEDVAKIIKLVDYPAKEDPMNIYDGQTTGNPQRQLARLARYYRNTRVEVQEREPGEEG